MNDSRAILIHECDCLARRNPNKIMVSPRAIPGTVMHRASRMLLG